LQFTLYVYFFTRDYKKKVKLEGKYLQGQLIFSKRAAEESSSFLQEAASEEARVMA
jgi:hypothetical protein